MKTGSNTTEIAVLGLDDAARRRLLARLVRSLCSGAERIAELLPLTEELRLRGLLREDDDAAPGRRTTRQILDAILERGETAYPERESLFVTLDTADSSPSDHKRRVLEFVDVPAGHFRNDSGHNDPLHPLRTLEERARALIVCLPAERWLAATGVGATELDRTSRVIRSFVAARPVSAPPLALALVLTGQASEEVQTSALDELLAHLPTRRLQSSVWRIQDDDASSKEDAGDEQALEAPRPRSNGETDGAHLAARSSSLEELGRWLLERVRRKPVGRWWRALARVAAASLLLFGALFAWAALEMHAIRRRPLAVSIAAERRFLEEALEDLAFWSRVPVLERAKLLRKALGIEQAERALVEHALHLEDALRSHPALAEPPGAVELAATRYRTAAGALELIGRVIGRYSENDLPALQAARSATIERLRQKARIAEMPPVGVDTLPAWLELEATCPDRHLRETVIAPRIRTVVLALLGEAERKALATDRYPELFAPLRSWQERYEALAPEAFAAARARVWQHAWEVVETQSRGLEPKPRLERLLEALDIAPMPPSTGFLQRLGLALGPALHKAALAGVSLEDARSVLDEHLEHAGTLALLASLAPLYQQTVEQPAARGPAHLAALEQVVALVPRRPLTEKERKRLEALAAHLGDLARVGRYAVHVERAWVSSAFDSVFDSFDLTFTFESARSGRRRLGPVQNRRDVSFEKPLFAEGELEWKSWDRLAVRIHDDRRSVGVRYEDPGSAFGLHNLNGTWKDERGRGGFTLRVEPSPPVWFDFTGWPRP